MASNNNTPLFPEFPAASAEAWLEQIKTELKGAPVDKLYWQTAGDITVQPFYTEKDVAQTLAFNKPETGWEIRQDFDATDAQQANQLALKALAEGANAIGFALQPGFDLRQLLQGIEIQYITIHFTQVTNSYRLLEELLELADERGLDANSLTGSISVELLEGEEEELDRKEIPTYFKEWAEALPQFRTINVEVKTGIDKTEALGQALAKAHEYLYILVSSGVEVSEILPRMQFTVNVGADYFLEMANLRALRALWPLVVTSYTEQPAAPYIYATVAATKEDDPYTDMIRHTTRAMSAIMGGADTLSVDVLQSKERLAFLQHIARNTQLILQHEAKLDKVIDPAAGSYYLESLTNQLASKAWQHFKTIEAEGGYFAKYGMFL